MSDRTTPIDDDTYRFDITVLGPEAPVLYPKLMLSRTNDKTESAASTRDNIISLLGPQWSKEPISSIRFNTSAATASKAHQMPMAAPNHKRL
jgi:hypothetical protein